MNVSLPKCLRVFSTALFAILLLALATHAEDHPRLPAGVRFEDVVLQSKALQNRYMSYRVVLPESIPPDAKLPVVWLLHGWGSNYRTWSMDSDIGELAARGVVLVMVEDRNTLFVNSATNKDYRAEDYFIDEVVPDVRRRFPVAIDPARNAIAGISLGGFEAISLALRHPQMFSYAGGISPAILMAARAFPASAISLAINDALGPMGSETRNASDPFQLIEAPQPDAPIPYFYLTCGDSENLRAPIELFAKLLKQRGLPYKLNMARGGHNWAQWNLQIPGLESSLLQHFGIDDGRRGGKKSKKP